MCHYIDDSVKNPKKETCNVQYPCSSDRCQCIGGDDYNYENDPEKSQKVLKDKYCDLEVLEQQIIESLINNVDEVEKQSKKQVHFKELDSITNKHRHLSHELLKYSNNFSLEATDDLEKDTLSKSSKAQCPYCNLELELSYMEGHKTECLYHQPCNELFESPDPDELQVNGIIDSETDACVSLIAHCPYCNLEKEVDAMEAHKDNCSHRPCICQYCKKEVKNEKLSEHYVICDNNPVPEMSYF